MSITLAFSSPEVCCIALTLHSAHLFRGRAERRVCFLRRLRSYLTPALRTQTRTAESLRKAPLPVMPGLDAPGTSVRPLRLRVLRRVCRVLRSRHHCLLRPLRLHYLTQVPSAGPALTCEGVAGRYTNGKMGRAETALPTLRLSRILSVNLYRQGTSEVPLSYLCGEDFKAPRRFRAQSSNPASSAAPNELPDVG